MQKIERKRLALSDYLQGLLNHDTLILAQAITLVESQLSSDQHLANELIQSILPVCGKSLRIGITGIPGVGKSTFIETFGTFLTHQNKKVAVLAIDPSSGKTKGSILGDKTRMEELVKNPRAFIRPSATGSTLGGVTNRTREAILLCEAAGFDVVIVETVGVGQSETMVRGMVDYFLLLMLAGAGDELQGIKKGIMEMADGVVITKADGENENRATQAQADFQNSLHLFSIPESGVTPQVVTCSALYKKGMKEIWEMMETFKERTYVNGFFDLQRNQQNLQWFRDCYHQLWEKTISEGNKAQLVQKELIDQIEKKTISPLQAAQLLFEKTKNKLS